MFVDFYGLLEQPFGVTPDPAYLYLTRSHSEALASLSAGIKADRGFMVLVAEPGMGKTTLLYQLLDEFRDSAKTVYLFQTQCDFREFFQYILNEIGVDTHGMGLVAMHAKLNAMLFDEMLAGRRFVLVVDEAQNLDESVLESIRLLSNFETHHAKLLQIVLAGQPGLAAKLDKPELSQLRQRVAVISHLEPLTVAETACYVEYRLKVAGYWGEPLFSPDVLELIAKQSKGIPRNINNICFNSLSEACNGGHTTVTSEIVQNVVTHSDFASLGLQSCTMADAAPLPAVGTSPHDPAGFDLVGPIEVPVGVSRQQLPSQLTYKLRRQFKLARWIFSAVAVVSIALLGIFTWRFSSLRSAAPMRVPVASISSNNSSNNSSESHASVGDAKPSGSMRKTYAAVPQDAYSGQVLTVIAKPEQSLKEISLLYLGHFDGQLFDQICSLNPELKDPNHIQGGQLVRLPLLAHTLTKAIDTSEVGRAAKNETSPGVFTK